MDDGSAEGNGHNQGFHLESSLHQPVENRSQGGKARSPLGGWDSIPGTKSCEAPSPAVPRCGLRMFLGKLSRQLPPIGFGVHIETSVLRFVQPLAAI